jgi:hypothetical protein
MKDKLLGVMAVLSLLSLHITAKPTPLVVDHKYNRSTIKKVKAAHDVIMHNLSLEQVRFKILQATLADKTSKWLLEEDNNNQILVRWDYYPDDLLLYANIEYNETYIQLKYVDKPSSFKCINNVNGICYRNKNNDYYHHLKRLRKIIQQSINTKRVN